MWGPWGNIYCFKGTLNATQPSPDFTKSSVKHCTMFSLDQILQIIPLTRSESQLCDKEVDPFVTSKA